MAFSMVFSHPTIGNNASQWLPIIGPSAILFWLDPGKPEARSLGLYVALSLREWEMFNFTDVTLADEDTNSILTDNAKREIQGNEAMQVMQTGDQCNFTPIGSGAFCWPNLQPIQMVPSDGEI